MASKKSTASGPIWLSSMKCCMFSADSVAAMHPTLDSRSCFAELARLAAAGGTSSRLVSLPTPSQPQTASGSLAMYSFRTRSEMESLYHALTIDTLQLLHGNAIADFERRLVDGTASCIVGLPKVEAQAHGNKRCARLCGRHSRLHANNRAK